MRVTLAKNKKTSRVGRRIKDGSFPVVAIGASAGGLEAVTQLLQSLPTDTGMAFIYVQHLSPDHKSFLTALLSKLTLMEVQEAKNKMFIEPDHFYVIPPDKEMAMLDGHIKLMPRRKDRVANLPIDTFFCSLAATHKKGAIGIILSGSANDGTRGLSSIKEGGGLTFAQDDSAKFGSMPESAIASGAVDFVLSPKEIAHELTRLSKQDYVKREGLEVGKENEIEDSHPHLNVILTLLHKETGVDFSHYKMATIKRRILRRLMLHKIKTLSEYAALMEKKRDEINILYQDLLINVTGFFRDNDAHQYLKTTLFPRILKSKAKGEALRIWIPACSTGEEVYSIAMTLLEIQRSRPAGIPVQIFATDLSEKAIAKARAGEYTQHELKSVSPKRLQRFYTKSGHNYRISKVVRDMCVFAVHNILRDPPFSRLDFVSCCNLFIYLDAAAQKKVLATFHYALLAEGYLMLAKSETVGASAPLFTKIDSKIKIYSRNKTSDGRSLPDLKRRSLITLTGKALPPPLIKNKMLPDNGLDGTVDSLLLSRYVPASVVINHAMEILLFRGATNLYLRPSGKASLNILKLISPDVTFELRQAISKVIKTKLPVRRAGIEMKWDGAVRVINIEVVPVTVASDEPLLLVLFTEPERVETLLPHDKGAHPKNGRGKHILIPNGTLAKDRKIETLKKELLATRGDMHSFAEEQAVFNEELQTANEEIVSSNEELQSVNEELETSKEEIETANEELITTNQELQTRNDLLNESYDYSEAIISTLHEPMIILDKDLRVKSANESFYSSFRVTKEETERTLLYDLGNKQWNLPRLRELLEDIIPRNTHFHDFEVTHAFHGIGEKIMLLNARKILQKTHGEQLILLAINDITERSLLQRKEKELFEKDIRERKSYGLRLEMAVEERTKELAQANKELAFQNEEKEKRAAELIIANNELGFQNEEKGKRAAELIIANNELAFQNGEKEKRAAELIIANGELGFQSEEKEKRAAELIIANGELAFENNEKEKRAAELIIANEELAFENNEKEKRAAELIVANKELAFQNEEKEKRAAELIVANGELAFENDEKEKRKAELIIANGELAFENHEKEKRAAELIIANKELAFQNEEKEKRAAELIIANTELESFAYVSSHDLQEPLRKIQTLALRILEKEHENLSEKGKDYFSRMQSSAGRMQKLIEDLLAFSRLNIAERKFENTDLNKIVEEVKTELRDVIAEKHAIIEATNLCEVHLIPFQFRQLMYNLVSNALKFSKPGHPPHIIIKSGIEKGSKLNKENPALPPGKLQPENKYCHITVFDNGIGFDPQYKDRIFEVFQKLHGKEEYSGTGIGLAIVKKVVEHHNGIITVSSKLDEGATFNVYVPVS
jgi:two-component system CheB/CheR fusion protein